MSKSSNTYKGDRSISGTSSSSGFNWGDADEGSDSEATPKTPEGSTVVQSGDTGDATGKSGIDIAADKEVSPPEKNDKQLAAFGFGAETAMIKDEGVKTLNRMRVSFGMYDDEHHRLGGYIGGGWAPLHATSPLNHSVDGIRMMTIGAEYKYFTTPFHTFLGQYFLAGLSWNRMFWDYENPIYLPDEDVTISDDYVDGGEIYAGLGFNLAQTKRFHVGVEVVPSAIFWATSTFEGFDNDVFDPFYMLKLRVVFTYLK